MSSDVERLSGEMRRACLGPGGLAAAGCPLDATDIKRLVDAITAFPRTPKIVDLVCKSLVWACTSEKQREVACSAVAAGVHTALLKCVSSSGGDNDDVVWGAAANLIGADGGRVVSDFRDVGWARLALQRLKAVLPTPDKLWPPSPGVRVPKEGWVLPAAVLAVCLVKSSDAFRNELAACGALEVSTGAAPKISTVACLARTY